MNRVVDLCWSADYRKADSQIELCSQKMLPCASPVGPINTEGRPLYKQPAACALFSTAVSGIARNFFSAAGGGTASISNMTTTAAGAITSSVGGLFAAPPWTVTLGGGSVAVIVVLAVYRHFAKEKDQSRLANERIANERIAVVDNSLLATPEGRARYLMFLQGNPQLPLLLKLYGVDQPLLPLTESTFADLERHMRSLLLCVHPDKLVNASEKDKINGTLITQMLIDMKSAIKSEQCGASNLIFDELFESFFAGRSPTTQLQDHLVAEQWSEARGIINRQMEKTRFFAIADAIVSMREGDYRRAIAILGELPSDGDKETIGAVVANLKSLERASDPKGKCKGPVDVAALFAKADAISKGLKGLLHISSCPLSLHPSSLYLFLRGQSQGVEEEKYLRMAIRRSIKVEEKKQLIAELKQLERTHCRFSKGDFDRCIDSYSEKLLDCSISALRSALYPWDCPPDFRYNRSDQQDEQNRQIDLLLASCDKVIDSSIASGGFSRQSLYREKTLQEIRQASLLLLGVKNLRDAKYEEASYHFGQADHSFMQGVSYFMMNDYRSALRVWARALEKLKARPYDTAIDIDQGDASPQPWAIRHNLPFCSDQTEKSDLCNCLLLAINSNDLNGEIDSLPAVYRLTEMDAFQEALLNGDRSAL